MIERYRKLTSQLGKTIKDPGAHMPASAVLILRRRRKKSTDLKTVKKGGSQIKPIVEYEPFPEEYHQA